MASDEKRKELELVLKKFDSVDVDKLLRRGLGDESLEKIFAPILARIRHLKEFVSHHAPNVHDSYVEQAKTALNRIADLMIEQQVRLPSDYIAQKNTFVSSMQSLMEQARQWEPLFAATAILDRGFLDDEGIRHEYARVVDQLQKQTTATIATIKEEAEKSIQGAKALAEEIETRARKTAAKISIEEAQNQFNEATTDAKKKLKLWAWLTGLSVLILIGLAFAFMWWPLPPSEQWPVAIYHTILRIFVLSTAGASAAFFFRILRAHIHMMEKNHHRVRVANSVEGFVNSALEPQQRDLILAKLCEEIIDFGDPGIVKTDKEDIGSVATSGELMGRILAALSPKRS